MFNGKKITSSPQQQPWQDAAARDRAGEGNGLERSRSFPSHSLPPRPPAARPPAAPNALHPFAAPLPASNPFASRLPASNPFASRLPASNPFVSRLRASRPLSGPRDGSSSSSSSSSDLFFDANDEFPRPDPYETSSSSTASSCDTSLFTSEEDVSDATKAKREVRDILRLQGYDEDEL